MAKNISLRARRRAMKSRQMGVKAPVIAEFSDVRTNPHVLRDRAALARVRFTQKK